MDKYLEKKKYPKIKPKLATTLNQPTSVIPRHSIVRNTNFSIIPFSDMSCSFCFPTSETHGSAVGDTSIQTLLSASRVFLTNWQKQLSCKTKPPLPVTGKRRPCSLQCAYYSLQTSAYRSANSLSLAVMRALIWSTLLRLMLNISATASGDSPFRATLLNISLSREEMLLSAMN